MERCPEVPVTLADVGAIPSGNVPFTYCWPTLLCRFQHKISDVDVVSDEVVGVGAPSQQSLRRLEVAAGTGVAQRRPAQQRVPAPGVAAIGEQRAHGVGAAQRRRLHQRRAAEAVALVGVASSLQRRLQRALAALQHGPVQREAVRQHVLQDVPHPHAHIAVQEAKPHLLCNLGPFLLVFQQPARAKIFDKDLTQEHLVELLAAAVGVVASSSPESTQRFLKAALYESGDIAVFVDGVDEICPSYTDKLLRLLQLLLETKVKLVWVSSRPELGLKSIYLRGHQRSCTSRVGVLELEEDGQWLRLQHAQHEIVHGMRSGHIGEQLKREAPAARAQRPQAAEEDLVFRTV
ncbi:Protein of unknown function [Gryllus bimaculatus]|nr:Protein of unknown function [Gryllus bimaculatus]